MYSLHRFITEISRDSTPKTSRTSAGSGSFDDGGNANDNPTHSNRSWRGIHDPLRASRSEASGRCGRSPRNPRTLRNFRMAAGRLEAISNAARAALRHRQRGPRGESAVRAGIAAAICGGTRHRVNEVRSHCRSRTMAFKPARLAREIAQYLAPVDCLFQRRASRTALGSFHTLQDASVAPQRACSFRAASPIQRSPQGVLP